LDIQIGIGMLSALLFAPCGRPAAHMKTCRTGRGRCVGCECDSGLMAAPHHPILGPRQARAL
jgi:hypothetical protein